MFNFNVIFLRWVKTKHPVVGIVLMPPLREGNNYRSMTVLKDLHNPDDSTSGIEEDENPEHEDSYIPDDSKILIIHLLLELSVLAKVQISAS